MISYTLPPGLRMSKFPDGGEWPWKDGKPIRSVTKILDRVWPMPAGLPQWFLDRGKAVHHAATLIDKGTLNWQELDESLLPFCNAYRDLIETMKPIMEATEITCVHPSYAFGARIDRVVRLPGKARLLIGDIKCGTGKDDRYFCQLAGCLLALDEAHWQDYDIALFNLDKNGRPHINGDDDVGRWVNRFREILQDDIDFRSKKE